jgi:hypothetical protein
MPNSAMLCLDSQTLLDKDDANLTLECMVKNDVLAVLCCPLVQDAAPGVQSMALSCLARLAAADPALPEAIMSSGILDSVIVSTEHEAEPVQAAADAVLQALSSDEQSARRVMATGATTNFVRQLEHGSPVVSLCQMLATAFI